MKIELAEETRKRLKEFIGDDKQEIEKGANAIILAYFDALEEVERCEEKEENPNMDEIKQEARG